MNEETKQKFEAKKTSCITKAKEYGNSILNWAIDHPVQAGLVVSFLTKLSQKALVEHRDRKNELRRRTREYDPTIGVYYDLKRPLTNKEKLELSRRHKNGEPIGDILDEFNVL